MSDDHTNPPRPADQEELTDAWQLGLHFGALLWQQHPHTITPFIHGVLCTATEAMIADVEPDEMDPEPRPANLSRNVMDSILAIDEESWTPEVRDSLRKLIHHYSMQKMASDAIAMHIATATTSDASALFTRAVKPTTLDDFDALSDYNRRHWARQAVITNAIYGGDAYPIRVALVASFTRLVEEGADPIMLSVSLRAASVRVIENANDIAADMPPKDDDADAA